LTSDWPNVSGERESNTGKQEGEKESVGTLNIKIGKKKEKGGLLQEKKKAEHLNFNEVGSVWCLGGRGREKKRKGCGETRGQQEKGKAR